ncbi:MAG: ABC transporter permease subunit [Planctomycetota bacterium]
MPPIVRWLLSLVPLNPIAVRLIEGGSRRDRHMYLRSTYLFVLLVALVGLMLTKSSSGTLEFQDLALAGASAFEAIAFLQIIAICILTPAFMAGAIRQEANPRTWEILLTTPMSPLQIVLGMMYGRLFFVFALLLASLPLFAMTQYFGGVPGTAIAASYFVAGSAALAVGAIAVMLSVSRIAGRRAEFAFYVAVVSYLGITIAIDAWLRAGSSLGVTWMTPVNPFLTLRALINPSGFPRPDTVELAAMSPVRAFWFGSPVLAFVSLSLLVTLVLTVVSAFGVRRFGLEGGSRGSRGVIGEKTRAPRQVWSNPIAWREAAARQATLPKTVARWLFIATGSLWGLGLVIYYQNGGMTTDEFHLALIATVYVELLVVLLVALQASATSITREREDGTLDLLLTTPLTPSAYLTGKLRGLISFLTPLLAVPLGTVAVAGLFAIVTSDSFQVSGQNGATINVPIVLPEVAFMAPLVTVPFVAMCVMIGLQWSLRSKGTLSSTVMTVLVAGAIGGTLGLCGVQMGGQIEVVGPVVAAFNPLTLVHAAIDPATRLEATVQAQGATGNARFGLLLGSVSAAVVYVLVVLGLRASMTKNFDMTVRKLAGTR